MSSPKKNQGIWRDLAGLKLLWPYFTGDKRLIYFSVVLIPFNLFGEHFNSLPF